MEDEDEQEKTDQRLERIAETVDRNKSGQMQHLIDHAAQKKGKYKKRNMIYAKAQKRQADIDAFFSEIDEPLLWICGGCGSLSNLKAMQISVFSKKNKFLDPLKIKTKDEEGCNSDGLVKEAIVEHFLGGKKKRTVPLCGRCVKSLKLKRVPKFSYASGFRIGKIPSELAELNLLKRR